MDNMKDKKTDEMTVAEELVAAEEEVEEENVDEEVHGEEVKKEKLSYNRTAAGVMALFLGAFGIHKFYQKQFRLGILYVLLSWTGLPAMLSLFEGVKLLGTDSEEEV